MKKVITFLWQGKRCVAKAEQFNASHYQIVAGDMNGCMISIYDIVKVEEVNPYTELKCKFPDHNWEEAEEISPEDIQAAGEMYMKLKDAQRE